MNIDVAWVPFIPWAALLVGYMLWLLAQALAETRRKRHGA